ncbi:IS1-like element transposase [Aeromonas veronii]|uniref:IS1-like element transposase n=1 Tax=Aeromonas veronii TaxID=654 RepID=UPI0039F6D969
MVETESNGVGVRDTARIFSIVINRVITPLSCSYSGAECWVGHCKCHGVLASVGRDGIIAPH